ncbi:hypothetical protein [Sphingorhabdus sp.]|uniref:carboxypeptidase-like regulatory domain-containing protein n=1 Tax=Sphingorhabdus sp. TaxID=1902408 RepID=UPI00333E26FA
MMPDFQEVLFGDEGQIWLPIAAITDFGEGAYFREQNVVSIKIASGAEEVTIDTGAHTIKMGKLAESYDDAVTIIADQVFMDRVLLERFFRLTISGRPDEGYITVTSDRPLNRDLRLMRENARTKIGNQSSQVNGGGPLPLEFDYVLLSGIQADISYGNSYEFAADRAGTPYNIDASSELAFLTHHMFLSGNARGLTGGRWIAGRMDPQGDMFGIGGLSSFTVGDVQGQSAPMVGGLGGGVGLRVQAAPVTLTDSFNKTSIEGDAPPGWTAELYIASQLREYQQIGDDGRFQFKDINIIFGSNAIKVILFGPNGLVEERDYSQSVSAGMLPPGKVYAWGTVLQPGRTMLGIGPTSACKMDKAGYSLRGDWGLTTFLTLSVQGSHLSPCPFRGEDPGPVQAQSYRAVESRVQIKNITATLGVVNQHPLDGIAFYGSAVIPVANQGVLIGIEKVNKKFTSPYTGFGSAAIKDRYSISTSIPLGLGLINAGNASILAERLAQKSGFTNDRLTIFYSHRLLSLPVSHEIGLNRSRLPGGPWSDVVGTYRALTSYDLDNFQIRGEYGATINRGFKSNTLNLSGSYKRTEREAYSLGMNYNFRGGGGFSGSAQWDINRKFNFGVSGSYAKGGGAVAAQIGFSFGAHRGVGLTLSSQQRSRLGGIMIRPFVDTNYDGKFGVGEEVVHGLDIGLNGRPTEDDADHARDQFIWDVDTEAASVFNISGNRLKDEFQTTPFTNVIVTPRSGRVLKIDVPVVDAISLDGMVYFEDKNGKNLPVPLAKVEVLNAAGDLIRSTKTLSDGSFSIEDLLAGTWTIVASTDRLSKSKKEFGANKKITISKDSISVTGVEIVIPFAEWSSQHD